MSNQYTIEASFAFGLTIPGDQPYSSQQVRSALTLTEEISAESEAEAGEFAELRLATLADQVKLHAINQAGLSAATDENGVVIPVFGGVAQASTNVRAIETAPSRSAETEDDGTEDTSVTAPSTPASNGSGPMWDGRKIRIFDNRLTKKSEKSPDFRIQFLDVDPSASDDDKFKPFWSTNRDGTPNAAAAKIAAMAEANA